MIDEEEEEEEEEEEKEKERNQMRENKIIENDKEIKGEENENEK